jgi:hypothetical protein
LLLAVSVEGILCCPYRLLSDIYQIFRKQDFDMLSSLTEEEITPGLVWSDCIYAGVPVSYGADRKLLTVREMGLILDALQARYCIGNAERARVLKAWIDSKHVPGNVAVANNSGHGTGIEYGLRISLVEVTAFEPA